MHTHTVICIWGSASLYEVHTQLQSCLPAHHCSLGYTSRAWVTHGPPPLVRKTSSFCFPKSGVQEVRLVFVDKTFSSCHLHDMWQLHKGGSIIFLLYNAHTQQTSKCVKSEEAGSWGQRASLHSWLSSADSRVIRGAGRGKVAQKEQQWFDCLCGVTSI